MIRGIPPVDSAVRAVLLAEATPHAEAMLHGLARACEERYRTDINEIIALKSAIVDGSLSLPLERFSRLSTILQFWTVRRPSETRGVREHAAALFRLLFELREHVKVNHFSEVACLIQRFVGLLRCQQMAQSDEVRILILELDGIRAQLLKNEISLPLGVENCPCLERAYRSRLGRQCGAELLNCYPLQATRGVSRVPAD